MSERRLPGVANKVLRRRILRSERQIIPAVLRTPHQRIRRESPEAATASDSARRRGHSVNFNTENHGKICFV